MQRQRRAFARCIHVASNDHILVGPQRHRFVVTKAADRAGDQHAVAANVIGKIVVRARVGDTFKVAGLVKDRVARIIIRVRNRRLIVIRIWQLSDVEIRVWKIGLIIVRIVDNRFIAARIRWRFWFWFRVLNPFYKSDRIRRIRRIGGRFRIWNRFLEPNRICRIGGRFRVRDRF